MDPEVYKFVKGREFNFEIDLIHQLTSISFREPGFLWRLDKPFVWGPISGNVKNCIIRSGQISELAKLDDKTQIIKLRKK